MSKKMFLGDTGEDVAELQKQLINAGYGSYFGGEVDGYFGSGTESAVEAFQNSQGISETSGFSGTVSTGTKVTFLGGVGYQSQNPSVAGKILDNTDCVVTGVEANGRHQYKVSALDGSFTDLYVDAANIRPETVRSYAGTETLSALRSTNNVDAKVKEYQYSKVSGMFNGTQEDFFKDYGDGLYIQNLVTDTGIFLQVRPLSVSDSISTSVSIETPRGRSVGYVGYNSTANRTVSFTIPVHVDFIRDSSIEVTVNKLKALEYPNYTEGSIEPPRAYVNLYNGLKFTGICTVCDVDWGKDIINGAFNYADVHLTFKGVSEIPYTSHNVEASGN